MGLLQPHARHRGDDGEARIAREVERTSRQQLGNRLQEGVITRSEQGPAAAAPRAVTVHGLADALAALEAAASLDRAVVLLSAPGAAAYAGAAWFKALVALARER